MTGAILSAGALEELDGTPIRPSAGRTTMAVPWHRAAAAAAAVVAARPRLWLYALIAFLARGGLIVLALPIVVLPTFIGIANALGPASVSAGGPSPRLVAVIVAAVAALTALVLVGTVVAAAAETTLHRATVTPDPEDVPAQAAPAGETAQRPAAQRPAAQRPAAQRPAAQRPAAQRPAQVSPSWSSCRPEAPAARSPASSRCASCSWCRSRP
jgi:hypothetical protein